MSTQPDNHSVEPQSGGLSQIFKKGAIRWPATALALAAASVMPAGNAEAQLQRNKVFTMQIQKFPLTAPKSLDARNLRINCGLLGPNGEPTGSFALQFDLPPYYQGNKPKTIQEDIQHYPLVIRHLGGLMPVSHQMNTPWAELYGATFVGQRAGLQPRREVINNRTYNVSADPRNDRYSPVDAARKVCLGKENLLSPVYRVLPNGNVALNPNNL